MSSSDKLDSRLLLILSISIPWVCHIVYDYYSQMDTVYLPLSFCAALWAIDYSYHLVVFTVVTILLATTTCLVVMNLNSLARLSKEVYQQFRHGIITSMLNDAKWAPTGEAFSQFRPERVNRTPSE